MGYNFCGVGGSTNASYAAVAIRQHERNVLLGDSVCAGLKSTGADARNCLYIGPGSNTASYPDDLHPRMAVHNKGINLSFCDGHTEWFRSLSIPRGSFWARKL